MNELLEKLLMEPMLYCLPPWTHSRENLTVLLKAHPSIQFVSLVAVDLGGNDTDEKIPISLFIDEMERFFNVGVQTDGSSVVLHGIATLNNAKVDLVPDLSVNWFVDYNYDHICTSTGLPIGTLRIPAFLVHNSKKVDSRSILKRAIDCFTSEIKVLFNQYPHIREDLDISMEENIDDIVLTSATELEFWVKTPGDSADEEKLSTSQVLKEQYWKRTKGSVRTALEETILLLNKYGIEPEIGHKEVGGVSAKIGVNGKLNHVMEQLEIVWRYSTAIQAADNELFIREIIEETFKRHGLEVTFMAKPIEGVAGSGKHIHVGVGIRLNSGRYINIFTPKDKNTDYMSILGWGGLSGILRNYEVVNPFITSTNDAFNRLKPGFEAPVCIVSAIGHSTDIPSRNRTVLIGLIRDMNNPRATRFEIRSSNPSTNTYLALAALYQTMIDGIKAMVKSGMTSKELEIEFSKGQGEEKFYLEKDRVYRSEEDVFEYYTEEERSSMFGIPPVTVWENIKNFDLEPYKIQILCAGEVFSQAIIDSYRQATVTQWVTELIGRIIPDNIDLVRSCKKIHSGDTTNELDDVNWKNVNELRNCLMKDSLDRKALFSRMRGEIELGNYDLTSKLQLEMNEKITLLKQLYITYRRNLFEEGSEEGSYFWH
ncbi:glutamine synthetase [Alkaliphilus sp. B6464]|uniref:glutamine synthetase n=1 Tax=Alkaliphilus sp. B6464 TaxID=2731219 RepID=UPI002012E9CD|nr:glutamine synthetase [Alkaliphilus sp. B6464]